MRKDLIGLIVLLAVSLGWGLSLNAFRSESLPLVYERPSQRFSESGEANVISTWKPGISFIGLEASSKIIEQGSVIIIDARSDLFFEFGHISGAVNLARKNFEVDYTRLEKVLVPAIDSKLPLLVYCSGEHCEDAAKVAERLKGLGFPIILVFEGGYKQWEAAGNKTAKGK